MVTGRSVRHPGSRLTRPCSLPPTCTLTGGKALPGSPGVNETVEPGGDGEDERSLRGLQRALYAGGVEQAERGVQRLAEASDLLPGDTKPVPLTKLVILFAVIRAVAVSIAVAIAFGLHLPYADWMPIAALAAMRASLEQSAQFAVARLAGAIIGAAWRPCSC